ncbi:MAG: hypothetical protein IH594_14480, partial [Bacteroidales bacterium]|nr:hypothetical protein [Bacteroidales bacterium]
LLTESRPEIIVANLDRSVASFTLRAELFLSPELSLQYYGNPYFSAGDYESFRRVDQANSRDHSLRFDIPNVSYDPAGKNYSFDHQGSLLQFSDPDFGFLQYRSNLVFRWEYKPASTIYFVWSHDRSDWRQEYHPIDSMTNDLFGLRGNNVFMLKVNYWFSL